MLVTTPLCSLDIRTHRPCGRHAVSVQPATLATGVPKSALNVFLCLSYHQWCLDCLMRLRKSLLVVQQLTSAVSVPIPSADDSPDGPKPPKAAKACTNKHLQGFVYVESTRATKHRISIRAAFTCSGVCVPDARSSPAASPLLSQLPPTGLHSAALECGGAHVPGGLPGPAGGADRAQWRHPWLGGSLSDWVKQTGWKRLCAWAFTT